MTSQEMMRTYIKPSQVFVNVAPIDSPQDWQIFDKPADYDEAGNPNSAMYRNKLFGYDEQEFLSKQYK